MVIGRLQAKSNKGVGSMGSAPDLLGAKKTKQKRTQEPSRAESPLGSDEETRAVQEATIQGLTVELERTIVEQEELRVQLERTQLERMRAVAQRDEAIQALELAHTQNEELNAQLEKLQGVERPQPETVETTTNPAQMPELDKDVVAAAAAVAESLVHIPPADVQAVEAAATKIQAVERGRAARANSPTKKPEAQAAPEPEPAVTDSGVVVEDQFVSTDPVAEEAAATKIQAVHRGKAARQQVAQSPD